MKHMNQQIIPAPTSPAVVSSHTQWRSPEKKMTTEERMKKKQDNKPVEQPEQVRDSEEEAQKVQMEIDGTTFPSPLTPYIPLRKMKAKPVKELKDMKYGTFTPLFLESVRFTRETLGQILQLKFAYYNFNDRNKYPQFARKKYLKKVHYPESGVTRLELQQWVA